MNYILETDKITKSSGNNFRVKDVSLKVPEHCVFGFLGPNGAGKTTTLKIILGLIRADSGEIRIMGESVTNSNRLRILRQTGSLIENPGGYAHLTGLENMQIIQKLKGVPEQEITKALQTVRLFEQKDKKLKHYSLGMRQRLGIAMALLGNPKILILDEPTNGLDPAGIQEMRELIRTLPRERDMTVIVSSHLLSEIEQMADYVGIHKEKTTLSVHSNMPAELIKLKRSPIWIAFVVMPVISALIGVFNFMLNQGTLSFKWSDLWTQQSLFLGIFFLSPLIAICCSLLCRMEHTGNNWNNVLTVESPAKIVKDKLLVASGVSVLCVIWIGVLYVLSGMIIGLDDVIPKEFYESMLCGAFACIAISSLQIFLSLIIKSFAIPVGIALAGGLGGLMMLSRGLGYGLPYAMLQKGLRSTNLTGELNILTFIAISIAYAVAFYLLSIISCKNVVEKG